MNSFVFFLGRSTCNLISVIRWLSRSSAFLWHFNQFRPHIIQLSFNRRNFPLYRRVISCSKKNAHIQNNSSFNSIKSIEQTQWNCFNNKNHGLCAHLQIKPYRGDLLEMTMQFSVTDDVSIQFFSFSPLLLWVLNANELSTR